jgi:precorrin-2/cobalt-factor-2 C20-methyltransferase
MAQLGTFWGVGVGPGDPELLTLKAHRILTQSPVVCIPKQGFSTDGYSYNIVKGFLDGTKQELVELIFPMTKDIEKLRPYWDENLSAIMQRISTGKDCAFITEGDPLLYSTFTNIYQLLSHRHPEVPVRVVPGVTSISGVSAQAMVPLAHGNERIAIIPATYGDPRLRQVLEEFDSIALMKVNSVFDQALDLLEELGLVDCAVYIKKATAGEEEVIRDIRSLRGKKLEYLSMLLVKKPTPWLE